MQFRNITSIRLGEDTGLDQPHSPCCILFSRLHVGCCSIAHSLRRMLFPRSIDGYLREQGCLRRFAGPAFAFTRKARRPLQVTLAMICFTMFDVVCSDVAAKRLREQSCLRRGRFV